jgi:hypothetical protein
MSTPHSPSLVAIARAAGPAGGHYELTAELDGAFVVVQELLPGAAPAIVDRPLVDTMIELNHRMAGLLADQPQVPAVRLYLRGSGPGYCLHEPLARYDGVLVRNVSPAAIRSDRSGC